MIHCKMKLVALVPVPAEVVTPIDPVVVLVSIVALICHESTNI